MLPLSEKIRSVPSFRPVVLICIGIIFDNILNTEFQLSILTFVLCIILIFSILIFVYRLSHRRFPLLNLLIILGFFTAGIISSKLNRNEQQYPGKGFFLAESVSLSSVKSSSVQVKLKLIQDAGNETHNYQDYFIYAYFPKDSKKELPRPGDVLIINTELKQNSNAGNPSEFDYAGYLDRNKIFSTIFLPDSCWQNTSISSTEPYYLVLSLKIKQMLQDRIKKIAEKKYNSNYQVLLAICTGDKSELGREIKTLYSRAGAIHVMAVSGLHVGMIWMFLNYLTFFLRRNRMGRILQFILIMILLWLFALITGMSASVVRSCLMFGLASTAYLIRKNVSVFNGLSVSALVQIIINPLIIYDVGFQFSYLAVISILLFLPFFQKKISSRYYLLQKILALLFVSLSAQVLTFPITLYYFHQFPLYFLLTNLFIIPLVTLVMTSFLISLLLLPFQALSIFFLSVSLLQTEIMNMCILKINTLPFHIIEATPITKIQVFLLLIIPLLLLHFNYYKKFMSLFNSFVLSILVILAGTYNYENRTKNQLCVLNIREMTAIDVALYGRHFFICSDTTDRSRDIQFAASGYWFDNFLDPPDYFITEKGDELPTGFFELPGYQNYIGILSDKIIVIVHDMKALDNYVSNMKKKVDLIVLGDKQSQKWKNLLKTFEPDFIVLDSSIPWYYKAQDIPDSISFVYHRIEENGAFLLEL